MYYTTDRLRWLISHWPEVVAAAESPGTASHLVSRSADKAGPSPTDPRGGRRSVRPPVDQLRWADVVVDVERAYLLALTGVYSLERTVVRYRMQGYAIREIEDALRIRHGDGSRAFRSALTRMSEHLEGGPPPTEQHAQP